MYIKKLDLLFFLVNNFSEWQFAETNFIPDSEGNNMLITKVISTDKTGTFATIKVCYNYTAQMLTSEIDYL